MDLTSLLIQAVSGAIGGNAAGAVSKDTSLGSLGNTIAGAIGGGVGGQILSALLGAGSMTAGLDARRHRAGLSHRRRQRRPHRAGAGLPQGKARRLELAQSTDAVTGAIGAISRPLPRIRTSTPATLRPSRPVVDGRTRLV